MENVSDKVLDSANARQVNRVWDQVGDPLWETVEFYVDFKLEDQVCYQVYGQVWEQVEGQINEKR